MGLKAGTWGSRLRGWRLGGGGGTKKEKEEKEEKKEEKIPHMCESIGHQPLQGRCPKSMKLLKCCALRLGFEP